MSSRSLLLMAVISLILPGCRVAELVFCAFSNAYTGGGRTSIERQADFNREWDKGCEIAQQEDAGHVKLVSVPEAVDAEE